MKKKNNFPMSFWIFIILGLIIISSYSNMFNQGSVENIDYSEMLDEVRKKRVSEVEIVPKDRSLYEIKGTFRDGTEFLSNAPMNDEAFFKTIHENDVKIISKITRNPVGRMFGSFFLYFGPILLLIIFWIYMMNRSQGGAGGAMSFGKSRAKLAAVGGKVTFGDVAGIDEAKEELEEIIEFLKDPKKFQKLGGRIPKGVILLGPPGSGKTLLARAVAGEAGVPFFSLSGSDFVEMFVGVGASRVRDLFEQGKKNAPCIIFIDEIDAVGRQRGAGLGGGHDEREQTLNALLVEMDGFETNSGVIIIAATNRPDVLDPALLRPGRFDRQVVVDRADLKGREKILEVHSKRVKLDETVDLSVIAKRTSGFSGADLENLVNEAALLAARKNMKTITMSELEESIDRVIAGPQRRSRIINESEKKRIAYHESGHALIAKILPNTHPVHKISIIPRGYGALGYTLQLPEEDRFLSTRDEMMDNICVMLGGRVAEELIFGDISTGASNDIERVTVIAHDMVCKYGMTKELGTVTLGSSSQEVFIGKDLMKERNYSEQTAKEIDTQIRRIIDDAHEMARIILTKNRNILKKIAEKLLKEEVIEGASFEEMFNVKIDRKIVEETRKIVKKKVTAKPKKTGKKNG
ncbi:MAG: ATP-dependent zinc metalloprotease FtsH [Candidatus Goldiibacteriota bacterium]